MRPYAELLAYDQPYRFRRDGHTRILDTFGDLCDPETIIEFAGRVDYGPRSTGRLGDKSIIKRWIDAGHESMLEMADATFYIECSRVVSHELVRHRLASFQQESQRYVKYDADESDVFYYPPQIEGLDEPPSAKDEMEAVYQGALRVYGDLRERGVPPQIARYVLPNAMRTRLIVKANMREWRHIIRLRMHPSAQPEMQELMKQIYEQLLDIFPNVLYNVVDERGVR